MNIKNLDLRHLRYFVTLAEELNFTRAAEKLHIAQPPLSHQIKLMEAQLGHALFTRTQRRVILTLVGHQLLPKARRLLADFQNVIATTRSAGRGESGTLRIGLIGSAAHHPVVTNILGAFSNLYPGARLQLIGHTTGGQIKAFREGALDVGFHWPSSQRCAGLSSFTIAKGELGLCLATYDKRKKSKNISLRTFENDLWLHTPRSGTHSLALYELMQKCWEETGCIITEQQEISEVAHLLLLIASGQGVSLLPDFLVAQAKGISFLKLEKKLRAFAQYNLLLSAPQEDSEPLVQRFCSVARSVIKNTKN